MSSRYLEENFLLPINNSNKYRRSQRINLVGFNNLSWVTKLNSNGMFNNINRDIEINVIDDLISGRSFEHWFRYKITKKAQDNCDIDYRDNFKKAFVYINFIKTLVEDIAMQCPVMDNFDPKQELSDKEIKYLKEELDDIDWISVSIDTIKELELKGDCFYQIYYDEELKKHRFIKLKTENMLDIIIEDDNDIKYVYKNVRIVKTLDIEKSIYTRREVEDLIIFTNGYYVEYLDVTDLDITSAKSKNIVMNTKEMGDILPIIHISGKYKRYDSEFSEIPSVDYIDPTLDTNTIITDIRSSNRNAGSPRWVVINGDLDLDRSVLDPGGIVHIETPEKLKGFHSRLLPETNVKSFEITNSLASLNKELIFYMDFLYRIVGLIPPTLQEKMSSSDSSKAIAQFRTKQEVKNKYYMSSIRKGFSLFFGLLLKDMNKRSKKDKIFLQIPKILVTANVYDNLLLVAQEIGLGLTTMQDYLKEQGYSEKQIKDIMNNQKEVLENSQIEKENTEIKKIESSNNKTNTDTKIDTKNKNSGVDNRFKKT